jgi:hypothetical protein
MMKKWPLLAMLLLLPLAVQAGKKNDAPTLKVVVVQGGVKVLRNGKIYSKIWTKFPDVRGWKLQRDNTEIVIKSGVSREPGLVELFDVKSGQRLDRIRANQVKDGKPAWAKNFAE